MMADPRRLAPTPHRLAILDYVAAGHLTAANRLRADEYELVVAQWIAPPTEPGKPYTVTIYGRGLKAVRLMDWGDHLVAETGDEDEPRVIGEAAPATHRRWAVYVGETVLVRNKHAARLELRHMAALVLAAEENESQPSRKET